MKKKKYSLEDVPDEVQKMWALEWAGQPIGSELMKEYLRVKEKYPQYFNELKKQLNGKGNNY